MSSRISARLSLVLIVIAFLAQVGMAQWIPIQATETTTRIVTNSSGKVLQKSVSTSVLYRSAAGSRLTVTQSFGADGVMVAKTGTLYDNVGLAVYKLNYGNKSATEVAQLPKQLQLSDWQNGQRSLGHATIDSLNCNIIPIKELINGSEEIIGRAWISTKDDLLVKQDYTLNLNGDSTHVIMELSNIQPGTNLPSSLFQVPTGFLVLKNLRPTPPSMKGEMK